MKQPSGRGTVVNKCQNMNPSANKASSVSCGFIIILINPYIGIKYAHFFILIKFYRLQQGVYVIFYKGTNKFRDFQIKKITYTPNRYSQC